MTPKNFAERLLTDNHEEGANLTRDELNRIYLNDYTGDFGLAKASYRGKSDSGEDHSYLALFHIPDSEDPGETWTVTDLYVGKKPDGQLTIDFGGSPLFSSADRATAEAWFAKESHMKGHERAVKQGKEATARDREHEEWRDKHRADRESGMFRRGGGGGRRYAGGVGGSPHWDGNRYAI
jgi:hypothetical protein